LKLFITGISGLLGANFALQCRDRFQVGGAYLEHPVAIPGAEAIRLDVTSRVAAEEALNHYRPDVIVHTAALTNVDECEDDPQRAHLLNVTAARNMALIATALGSRLVHVSTDQLFDGAEPWVTEASIPTPLNNYGRTKSLAERAVLEACPGALVVRTNFYGWGTPNRRSFSDWIIRNLELRTELTMFTDVSFTPILINQLIDVTADLIISEASGVFHVAGRERLSKHAFALKLARALGYSQGSIRPISVDQLSLSARRPKEMSLSSEKVEALLQVRMPTVAEGLERLRNLKEQGWQQELERAFEGAPHSQQT
jgi:dTDP-4-dehydrorhamnose reductase